jgi:hypothetical protein
MILIHLFLYLIEAASFYTSEELLKTFTHSMLIWLLGDVFGKGIMATAQRYKRRLVSTPVTTAVTTAAYLWDMATATHGLRQTSTHPEAKGREKHFDSTFYYLQRATTCKEAFDERSIVELNHMGAEADHSYSMIFSICFATWYLTKIPITTQLWYHSITISVVFGV